MKLLIVDDEQHVREGIELSISAEKFGITDILMAENGLEALELIKISKPAVVFCDMKMPMMNGIELLEKIRELQPNTQVIVISGYSDFEYTRAAIKANGVDYILKPFHRKELEEALQKAVNAWNELESKKQSETEHGHIVRKADAMLDEKKLASYARGESQLNDAVRRLFAKHGLSEQALSIAVILPRKRMDIVGSRFEMDEELFFFAVDNIARDAIGERPNYLCRLNDYQWLIIVGANSPVQRTLDPSFDRVRRAWKTTLGLDVLIGQCPRACSATELVQAIGEAKNELLGCDVLSGKAMLSKASSTPEIPPFMNQQLLLQTAIDAGNKRFVLDIVGKYGDSLRAQGTLALKSLQICSLEANLLLSRLAAKQSGASPVPNLPLWISDLEEWEKMLLQQFWVLLETTNSSFAGNKEIEAIREYLNHHFHEDISFSTLSEKFHLSPQYISKKFKETYNTTVISYLTELKIEKAEALLANTNMPVAQIANQLGYDDENYFSKVFKKQTGMSPLRYRKVRQQTQIFPI
ncbi:response regulator transcription factor [Cohnella terricola]|uniref:Response regulator n=1 Tax=Cohnella terricola TaxID=1289167 RepID=A0A559J9X8_9BACL|nr:response regulator [Cohnella terricola]TVX96689.1 response regulator [Cohnella terricola]